jgi:hypothetical protein
MNNGRRRGLSHLVAGAILGVVAFTLVLAATDPPGPGLDPDAMAYMGAAESVAGQGRYRVPAAGWDSDDSTSALTHFPPGYSTALALPVRLGMSPPQAARLLQALAAAVTVATLVWLVADATTLLAGLLLGLALMVTTALAQVHTSVLSEPLFLACLSLMLAAMTRHPGRPLRTGIPAALAAIVRYAGVAVVGAAAIWAFAQRGTLTVRFRRAAIAVLPAVLLQGLWVLRTRRLHEPAEIRHFAMYGRLGPTLQQAGATIRDWLIPDRDAWSDPMPYRGALACAAVVVVAAVLYMGARRAIALWRTPPDAPGDPRHEAPARLLAACALLVACYLGMLVVSRLLADPGIPFDERILSPALLLATVAIATSITLWWRTTSRLLPRLALGVALCGWWTASAATTGDEVAYALDWGSDFAGEQWRRSELLDWARTEGATHPLYTNWPSAVWFHLHRPSRYLPGAADTTELAAFAELLRATDGRALVFSVPDADYMTREALARASGLRVVVALEDGVVLAARAP